MDVRIERDLEEAAEHAVPQHPDPSFIAIEARNDVQHITTNDESEIQAISETDVSTPKNEFPIKFEVERDAYIDKEGRQWSIELKPHAESREQCQKRIKKGIDELRAQFNNDTLGICRSLK